MAKIPFKGYCFAVGTTSYRTDKFNLNIERQLEMMSRFRELPENRGISWDQQQRFPGRLLQLPGRPTAS